MKRIAVIGASGQLGRAIVAYLHAKFPDAEILGLSRKTSQAPGVNFRFDPEQDNWAMLGKLDIVINAAGIIQESKDEDFELVHVQLPRKIIENRYLVGNPRIIQISALGADEQHPIAFLRTKGIGDAIMLKQSDTFVLRPSIICTHNTLLVQKFKMLFDISKLFFNRALMPSEFLKTRIQPVMEQDVMETVAQVCVQQPPVRLLNIVGAEEISFGWLVDIASKMRGQKFFPIEIPKNLVAAVTRNFIAVWFPGLINYDQFQLLFKDNVADKSPVESFLGRPMQATRAFWEQEFKEEH